MHNFYLQFEISFRDLSIETVEIYISAFHSVNYIFLLLVLFVSLVPSPFLFLITSFDENERKSVKSRTDRKWKLSALDRILLFEREVATTIINIIDNFIL